MDDTFNLNPSEISRLATPRTKAVIVVHYQGVAADMDPILAAAKKAGVAVLEDGRVADARRHLQAFLELAPESPWATAAGERLASLTTDHGRR